MTFLEIKDSKGNVYDDYKKYLASKHWRDKKREYSRVYVNMCVICGKKTDLHIHHMTYIRVGDEHLNDLVFLCSRCHSLVHSGVEEIPPREVLNMFKKKFMNKIDRELKKDRNCKRKRKKNKKQGRKKKILKKIT